MYFEQFTKHIQYRQYNTTHEMKPVVGKAQPMLKALFGHSPVIMQTRPGNSNDGNNDNIVMSKLLQ